MKVKCKKCGTEYEMPPITEKVTIEDCPVCKYVDEQFKEFLHSIQ